jgi:hypothetical protein
VRKEAIFCDVCADIMEEPNLGATQAMGAYTPMLRKVLQCMMGVSGGDGSEVCGKCEKWADDLLSNSLTNRKVGQDEWDELVR